MIYQSPHTRFSHRPRSFSHSYVGQRGAVTVPRWFLSWIFPLSVFFIALIIYMRTMCPTIYPGDGAELTAAAWSLGVPHPTGYPLYMVLGFLFQHIGLGSPAFSMNLLTAVFGALACVGVYRLQREIWRIVFGIPRAGHPAFSFAAAGLAVALGVSATWWDQSTQTEVYTLMLAFVVFAWTMALRLIRRPTRNGLWCLALLSGFAMLHHMLFIITFPLSLIAVIRWWIGGKREEGTEDEGEGIGNREQEIEEGAQIRNDINKTNSSRTRLFSHFAMACLLFILPLFGYLYLPLRAASLPPINWGNPQGIQGILWHLTGQQYAATKIMARPNGEKLAADEIPDHIQNRLRNLGRWMSTQYAPFDVKKPHRGPVLTLVVVLLAGLGVFMLWRHSPLVALGLVSAILLNLFFIIIYTIADIHAYQIPLLILLGCLAMTGPVTVAEFFPPKKGEPAHSESYWNRRGIIVGVLALGLAVFSAFNWYPPQRGINKSHSTEAYQFADTLMRVLPPNSVLFTFSDFDIFPLWYIQTCERQRPDVAVMGANFVQNGWYAAQLRATLPRGIEAYITNEPPGAKERWLVAFLGGMVAPALQTERPVYLSFYDPAIAQYFSLEQRFQVPLPTNQFVLGTLAGSAQPAITSPRKATGLPPLPVYELADPVNSRAIIMERFLSQFPAQNRQFVRRGKLDLKQ